MDNDPIVWCITSSKQAGESLTGTAVEASRWLLVEYDQPWPAKAVRDSVLPDAVKSYLNDLPDIRVQFIRQAKRASSDIRIFIADTNDLQPRLFTTTIANYEVLMALNFDAILAGNTELPEHHDPLFLVCCNGKRDLCCAKFGLALYTELDAKLGDSVWQTTHLGGHRFAPTALILPEGLSYGWIDDRADEIITAYNRDEIVLDLYRGRVSYLRPVQAAETFLRKAAANLTINACHFINAQKEADDEWAVTFLEVGTDTEHTVRVKMVVSDFKVYKSTGDIEPAHVPQYEQVRP